MKNILLNLLARVVPSQIIINNCIELIQREQVGTDKYGVTLEDAKLTHEQVLQHLLEEQLDGANYIRKALHTASHAERDYAFLRKKFEELIRLFDRHVRNQTTAWYHEQAVNALYEFDAEKVLRDLKK